MFIFFFFFFIFSSTTIQLTQLPFCVVSVFFWLTFVSMLTCRESLCNNVLQRVRPCCSWTDTLLCQSTHKSRQIQWLFFDAAATFNPKQPLTTKLNALVVIATWQLIQKQKGKNRKGDNGGLSWLIGVHCLIGKQDGGDGGDGSTARPAVVNNKVCVCVCAAVIISHLLPGSIPDISWWGTLTRLNPLAV